MIPQTKQENLPGLHFPPSLQLHLSDPKEQGTIFSSILFIFLLHNRRALNSDVIQCYDTPRGAPLCTIEPGNPMGPEDPAAPFSPVGPSKPYRMERNDGSNG